MPAPRVLLSVSALGAALSIMAAAFAAGQASMGWSVVALGALVGYVAVAGRSAGLRVRPALMAGLGLLVVVLALRLFWYRQPAEDFGWFAYGPLGDLPDATLDPLRRAFDHERIIAVGQLLGVLCLATAVVALPRRHRPKRAALTTTLAVLVLGVLATGVADWFDRMPVLGLLGAVWPALLATIVAAGGAALAGWRDDLTWLVLAGSLVLAVAAATAVDDLAATWWTWWTFAVPHDNVAFPQLAISVSAEVSPDMSAAVDTTVALAGPILLAIGAVRAAGEAQQRPEAVGSP
jgi:hypothetical protein